MLGLAAIGLLDSATSSLEAAEGAPPRMIIHTPYMDNYFYLSDLPGRPLACSLQMVCIGGEFFGHKPL